MSSLQRILLRDLSRLRGQVITISLVVASGISVFITMRGAYESLQQSKAAYYERNRFADVFCPLSRAPDAMIERVRSLEGVAAAVPRIAETVAIPLPALAQPAAGRVISLPDSGRPRLNAVHLRSGRFPEPGRTHEALLLESFAEAHDLKAGDSFPAVINGVRRRLEVVGTGMSPEFVFALEAGSVSHDPKRFGVLWMNRDVVAAAFDLDGAFNSLLIKLQPGMEPEPVLAEVDHLMTPYGGTGAFARERQLSAMTVEGELGQLESWAIYAPIIFLGVAAFLLHVVLSRLIHLQRSQIATLKAVGYSDRSIGLHYLAFASLIVFIGAVLGVIGGAWMGHGLVDLYKTVFRFPNLRYELDLRVVSTALLVSFGAAVVGALQAVRSVIRLPPAEAMRPPPPASYRRSLLERFGLMAWFSPASRMVVREIERRPLRVALSAGGISMAVAILVVGRFGNDSVGQLLDVQFQQTWREDLMVSFLKARPLRAAHSVSNLPGVMSSEVFRTVPARVRAGHIRRDIAITGFADNADLRIVRDRYGNVLPLPVDGVLLSRKLSEILGLEPGEQVAMELREGDHRRLQQVTIAGTVDDAFGLQGYARLKTLQRLLHESDAISGVLLKVDPRLSAEVQRRLNEMPLVGGVERRENALERFQEQSADWMLTVTLIMALFASVIAVGVVYNNARVALSMRSRDLGSLRVLGFTRGEISRILLSELAVQVLIAIPVGLMIGLWMCFGIMATVDPEVYRLPVTITGRTYAFATVVILASGTASALLVRRKLDRLDLIGVLKSRE